MIYPLNQPLAELLLLSIITQDDSYGYSISQRLKKVSNVKDSALYPMLKRLSDQNYVEIYDRQFQGRNRKYYKITEAGDQHRLDLRAEWEQYCDEISYILEPQDDICPEEETTSVTAVEENSVITEGGSENE